MAIMLAVSMFLLSTAFAAHPVVLFADFSVVDATLSNVSFAINAFQGFDGSIAGAPGSPAYKEHVGAMLAGRGIVR
jgi:hypothetical protein